MCKCGTCQPSQQWKRKMTLKVTEKSINLMSQSNRKKVPSEARSPKLTPKIAWIIAWRDIQVHNEVTMLKILKSPESRIKPMRSAYFRDLFWSTSEQTRSCTRLNAIKVNIQYNILFTACKKFKSETSRLFDWNFLGHHFSFWCPLSKKAEPEKFPTGKKIPSNHNIYFNSPKEWYGTNPSEATSLLNILLFISAVSLSLFSSQPVLKQLKSDYSRLYSDRDPHHALRTDNQSLTLLVLVTGPVSSSASEQFLNYPAYVHLAASRRQ